MSDWEEYKQHERREGVLRVHVGKHQINFSSTFVNKYLKLSTHAILYWSESKKTFAVKFNSKGEGLHIKNMHNLKYVNATGFINKHSIPKGRYSVENNLDGKISFKPEGE